MSITQASQPLPVGHLHFHLSAPTQVDIDSTNLSLELGTSSRTYPIWPRQEFDIGRMFVQDMLGIMAKAVSAHHLRVRCVMYEDDTNYSVPPMVSIQVLSSNGIMFTHAGLDDSASIPVKPGDDDILLSDGDRMQLTRRISVTFRCSEHYSSTNQQHGKLRQAEMQRFSKRFVISNRMLGAGGFAGVFLARDAKSQQQLACKILRNGRERATASKASEEIANMANLRAEREKLAREYTVLKDLSHPNIVRVEKVFYSTSNIYIFQELVTGGDLLSYVDCRGPLSEGHAAMITRQLLEAVKYLHDNNIVHRDIKLENVLMTSSREGARIVLTDFGQARSLEHGRAGQRGPISRMQSAAGTCGYIAPELYSSIKHPTKHPTGYSKAVDIWSIGCIVPMLITSDPILPGEELQHRDATSHSKFGTYVHELSRSEYWTRISAAAKSFIKNCLRIDEQARLTAASALQHEWFTHSNYREEFDAAYQRAIQSWRPRKRSEREPLIEMIDTTDFITAHATAAALSQQKRQGNYESRSQHFKNSPLRPVRSNACRVQKPPPLRASAAGGVRGARSPMGGKMERMSFGKTGIFASSIGEQIWRPL